MSANQGTLNSFSSIADFHEDLNVGGAGNKEYEFLSGTNKNDMITWGQWMDYVLFNKTYPTKSQTESDIAKSYEQLEKQLPIDKRCMDAKTSIYDVLSADKRLSKMKAMWDFTGWGKVKDQPITLLVPVNDFFEKYLYYQLYIGDKWASALSVLRYHTLPYIIRPWQLNGKKMILRTDLALQTIESDWTQGKPQFINPISERVLERPFNGAVNSVHYGDPMPSLPDGWFPKTSWEVNVIGFAECYNGLIYIIDRPLVQNFGI
jgi:hypothetical protein